MTNKELIKKLLQFPLDMKVIIECQNGYFDEITKLMNINVDNNYNRSESDYYEENHGGEKTICIYHI